MKSLSSIARKIVAGMALLSSFALVSYSCQGPADGVLSPYIIGTYDQERDSLSTVIQVINPTADSLEITAYFLDGNEQFQKCIHTSLSANDMVEIGVPALQIKPEVGVVKIVSFRPGTKTPQEGIVGYKRSFVLKRFTSEAPLHSIPSTVLEKDLPQLLRACGGQ